MFYFETAEMMAGVSFPLQLTIKYRAIQDLLLIYWVFQVY